MGVAECLDPLRKVVKFQSTGNATIDLPVRNHLWTRGSILLTIDPTIGVSMNETHTLDSALPSNDGPNHGMVRWRGSLFTQEVNRSLRGESINNL
jgi:hypothetical protein